MNQQLWLQLALAGAMIGLTTIVQAVLVEVANEIRPVIVHRLRGLRRWWLAVMVGAAALWMLVGQIISVWIWAGLLLWLGAFDNLEPALYFSVVAYTTVGFGDLVPPDEWRILGATIAANGMLGFGVATASLLDLVLRTQNELRQ